MKKEIVKKIGIGLTTIISFPVIVTLLFYIVMALFNFGRHIGTAFRYYIMICS